jgi:hypothetical protein
MRTGRANTNTEHIKNADHKASNKQLIMVIVRVNVRNNNLLTLFRGAGKPSVA